ncbi:hypothetical protein [Salsuginibacillus kocurii]|uniref:hypothetical protein n=1 Tax=Salsuginibacillus kocurii TaxID=427078 RepID=UPI00035DDC6F|nr:hypothetical protein [Salsuginibacillus kocurii]
MKDQGMLWIFISLLAFASLFFVGSLSTGSAAQSALQIIAFSGMVFSFLYGLLLNQHAEETAEERKTVQ